LQFFPKVGCGDGRPVAGDFTVGVTETAGVIVLEKVGIMVGCGGWGGKLKQVGSMVGVAVIVRVGVIEDGTNVSTGTFVSKGRLLGDEI